MPQAPGWQTLPSPGKMGFRSPPVVNVSSAAAQPAPPWKGLFVAWLGAVAVCVAGTFDLIAEWPGELAITTLVWLILGPVAWQLIGRGPVRAEVVRTTGPLDARDWIAAIVIGLLAWIVIGSTELPFGAEPPAYHDEYSYLFQAETLLAGRLSWPSPAVEPELFDQMHVLNEGRMASRYYPGTGLWLAPWTAVGHPHRAQRIAGVWSALLVYFIGRQLGGRPAGWIAGMLFAAAPGPALFHTLLLAHSPTLLMSLLFLNGLLAALRTNAQKDWWQAGIGLSWAMLCRPATAAAIGLPWGLFVGWQLIQAWRRSDWCVIRRPLLGLGVPLLCGWSLMLAYNQATTGDWRTSPYQRYTELYTPRHVFGLENGTRGDAQQGPKVLRSYDQWADNLTVEKAWTNTLTRFLATALWTIDPPLLSLTLLLALTTWGRQTPDERLAFGSIVALFAIHWPYWYAGIFGWHYVFEAAPLWCLLAGCYAARCLRDWHRWRRGVLAWWSLGLIGLAWCGLYAPLGEEGTSRWTKGINVLAYPRRQHGEFVRWIEAAIPERPALVLIEGPHDGQQLDYVVNHAGLTSPLLFGRFRAGQTDAAVVAARFPERAVYRCDPERRRLERVTSPE